MAGLPESRAGQRFLDAVKEAVEGLLGVRGRALDRAATVGDLVNAGATVSAGGTITLPSGGGGDPGVTTTPPTPTGFQAAGGFSYIVLSWTDPGIDWIAYAELERVQADGVGANPGWGGGVRVAQPTVDVYADPVTPGILYYYRVRFVSTGGTPGAWSADAAAQAALSPAILVDALENQITTSELHATLNTRIDLIDAASGVAGSVNARLLAETNARTAAIAQEVSDRNAAIAVETGNRVTAVQTEVDNRVAAITALDAELLQEANDRAAGDAATLGSANAYTVSYTYSQAAIDASFTSQFNALTANYQAADATTYSNAQSYVQTYAYAKSTVDDSIAAARDSLRAQYSGGYTGTDLTQLTSGLLYSERVARANADDSLAQSITLLSAGAGEQFDPFVMYYYDSGVESWTGNGAPAASGGWLKPANHATDPYVISPDGLGIAGSTYPQVKARIRKTGAPTWAGELRYITNADTTWNDTKKFTISEPSFDGFGISVVTWNAAGAWLTGTVKQIRLDLSTVQDGSNYYEIDWVAIGRPSPGASVAALLSEQTARASADSAEVTDRRELVTKLIGLSGTAADDLSAVTLANVTSGLIFDERSARTTADSTEVTARQGLAATLTGFTDPSGKVLSQITSGLIGEEKNARVALDTATASSLSTLTASVNAKAKVFRQQAQPVGTVAEPLRVGDVWIDTGSTNLLTYSEQFDNAAWSKSRATVVANQALGRDGNLTLDAIIGNTETAVSHYVYQTYTPVAGVPYALSFDVRAGAKTWCRVGCGFTGAGSAYFQLVGSGVVGSATTGVVGARSIQSLGGGLYRVSITVTPTNTASGQLQIIPAVSDGSSLYQGDGVTVDLYAGAGQLEQAANPGRYIPTTTASVSTVGNNKTYVWNGADWTIADDARIGSTLATLTSLQTTVATNNTAATGRLDALESTVNNGTTGVVATATALDVVEALVNSGTTGNSALVTKTDVLSARISNAGRALFYETFDDPNALSRWTQRSGTAELSIVSVTDGVVGGKAFRIGNNAGNDRATLTHGDLIPFDPALLYKLTVRARRTAGTGTFWCGWEGIAADGVTSVNAVGAASLGSQHAHCTRNTAPGASWSTYTGYTSGFGVATGDELPGTRAAPSKMHPNVRYLRPYLIANYTGVAGTTEIDSFLVEISEAADIDAQVGAVATDVTALETLTGHATHGNVALGTRTQTIETSIAPGGATANAISAAATTATWASVSSRPANLAALSGSEGIQNALIGINANGTLSGAGAGAVTPAGIGAATSGQVTTLTSRLDNAGGAGVTMEQSLTTQAGTITGLSAQYSLKIDNNGFLSGWGLSSEANNATPFSQFIFQADRFAIVNPNVAPATVTITRSGTTATVAHTAHGKATGDYVVIAGAAQREYNGTKQITVTGANAYTYTVSGSPATPATGTIKAGEARVPFTVQGGQVFIDTLMVKDGTFTVAKMQSAFMDTLVAAQGTIGQAHLGAASVGNAQIKDFIQSTTYTPGSTGWIINKDGTVEFNSGTFRSSVWAGSITSTAGVTIGAAGNIKGGQTAYNTGTGFWLGHDAGAYKASMRVAGGGGFTFDGAAFSIYDAAGNVTLTSGTFSGNVTGTLNGGEIGAFATLNQITAGNASTYIANAAIQTAQIADANITNAKIDRASANKLVVVSADIQDAAITTAKIGNAQVDTLQLAGQAVTIPVGTSASGVSFLAISGETQILSASITSSGAAITISAAGAATELSSGTLFSSSGGVRLYRDGVLLRTCPVSSVGAFAFSYTETPGAGTRTYSLRLYNGKNVNSTWEAGIVLLEVKR